ncbi:hypothetical protein ACHQM5_019826 [Ranunculus cassubicifolius]
MDHTNEENWSEAVEDLIENEDISGAISLLESLISKFETLNSSSSQLKLSTALTDLANLYSSRGDLSTKSDELRTRAFVIKERVHQIQQRVSENIGDLKDNAASTSNAEVSDDDDWEAVADRGSVEEVFVPKINESISKISLEDTHIKTPKRRGRGSFLYKKNSLYSDHQLDDAVTDGSDDHDDKSEEKTKKHDSRYGTKHVLVLADFSPSMRTIDLERLFENFKDRGIVIRWVNDTVALAVFRTASIALEAHNSIHCPFKVRVLSENDVLFPLVSMKDLEPPVPRPKTSARTAERLIAQGMGIKLSKTPLGSSEHRKQEEARKNRIVTRQILKNDAWGDD